MKTFSQICEFLNIKTTNIPLVPFKSLFLDSRSCDENSVFIAIKGINSDGNNYIDDVISQGVKLVLTDNNIMSNGNNIYFVKDLKCRLADIAQWFYNYKKLSNIIGITGTNGKTSISSYIAQLLNFNNEESLLLGTNGNGVYPNLETSTHTTLDTLSLYQKITKFLDIDNIVMEVSSHSLDQNRAKGLDFDIAVFSNISHDHLDYHHTMENYFLAKAKLFQNDSLQKAVINIDDEYGLRLCDMTSAKIITVSLKDKNADIHIHKKSISPMYTSFELWMNGKTIGDYKTKLIGEFNLMNLGLSLGAVNNIDNALKNIQKIDAVKGRMERVALKNGVSIIIDYAHTPDALEKVLQTLQEYKQNRLWCMFGCGGNRDTTKRAVMAKIVEQYSDKIIVTEDNSRLENVNDIFADISQGFENKQIFIQSREIAIKYIIENAKAGDIVLLAGKGHECYMDTKGQKIHFDEREIIAKYSTVI